MERKTTKPGESDSRPRRSSQTTRRYDPTTMQNARTLRSEHTDAEGLLWARLRGKGLCGHKFRRQQPIGPYVADFACMSEKLIVELDGGGHAERKAYDSKRDEFLRRNGYRVLRFWNTEVFENLHGVLEEISEVLGSNTIEE